MHAMGALTLHDRALGAFLGFAIGDALGATVEFMTKGEIAALCGVHDRLIGGCWLKLAPGIQLFEHIVQTANAWRTGAGPP